MKLFLLSIHDQRALLILLGLAVPLAIWYGMAKQHFRDGTDEAPLRQDYLFQIDPNTASSLEFQALPGIGETLADRIVADRQSGGPFRIPNDLSKVKGIGPKKIETIRPFLVDELDESKECWSVPAGEP